MHHEIKAITPLDDGHKEVKEEWRYTVGEDEFEDLEMTYNWVYDSRVPGVIRERVQNGKIEGKKYHSAWRVLNYGRKPLSPQNYHGTISKGQYTGLPVGTRIKWEKMNEDAQLHGDVKITGLVQTREITIKAKSNDGEVAVPDVKTDAKSELWQNYQSIDYVRLTPKGLGKKLLSEKETELNIENKTYPCTLRVWRFKQGEAKGSYIIKFWSLPQETYPKRFMKFKHLEFLLDSKVLKVQARVNDGEGSHSIERMFLPQQLKVNIAGLSYNAIQERIHTKLSPVGKPRAEYTQHVTYHNKHRGLILGITRDKPSPNGIEKVDLLKILSFDVPTLSF